MVGGKAKIIPFTIRFSIETNKEHIRISLTARFLIHGRRAQILGQILTRFGLGFGQIWIRFLARFLTRVFANSLARFLRSETTVYSSIETEKYSFTLHGTEKL